MSEFVNDIHVDDVVLVDNGAHSNEGAEKNRQEKVECEVLTDGKLGSRRHINLPGVKKSVCPH